MIRNLKKCELKKIYKEYLKNDFPDNERKPYAEIERYSFSDKGDAVGYFINDELIGYATVMFVGNRIMLDYFAILKDKRGKGIGTTFLRELKEYYTNYQYIAIEAEYNNSLQALKRIEFYKRAGCINTNIYLKLYFVDYVILILGKIEGDKRAEIMNLYKDLYPDFIGTKYFVPLN